MSESKWLSVALVRLSIVYWSSTSPNKDFRSIVSDSNEKEERFELSGFLWIEGLCIWSIKVFAHKQIEYTPFLISWSVIRKIFSYLANITNNKNWIRYRACILFESEFSGSGAWNEEFKSGLFECFWFMLNYGWWTMNITMIVSYITSYVIFFSEIAEKTTIAWERKKRK